PTSTRFPYTTLFRSQFVSPDDEELRRVSVMGFDGARVPHRPLCANRKYGDLVDGTWINGSRIGQEHVVACPLIYAGHVKLSNIRSEEHTSELQSLAY